MSRPIDLVLSRLDGHKLRENGRSRDFADLNGVEAFARQVG